MFLLGIVLCTLLVSTHSFIRMSTRLIKTESPYIEDVLDKYSSLPDLTMLALGSVYWSPPKESLNLLTPLLTEPAMQKYGSILGNPELRTHLSTLLHDRGLTILHRLCLRIPAYLWCTSHAGLSMDGMDIAITAGANQAFINAALAVCDNDDTAILLAPYYFSHKLSLQLCGAQVSVCPFDTSTLAPDFQALESMMAAQRPRMVCRLFGKMLSGHESTQFYHIACSHVVYPALVVVAVLIISLLRIYFPPGRWC